MPGFERICQVTQLRLKEKVLEEDIIVSKRSLIESANNHDIFSVEYYGTSAQKGERTSTTILSTVELFRESKMI